MTREQSLTAIRPPLDEHSPLRRSPGPLAGGERPSSALRQSHARNRVRAQFLPSPNSLPTAFVAAKFGRDAAHIPAVVCAFGRSLRRASAGAGSGNPAAAGAKLSAC